MSVAAAVGVTSDDLPRVVDAIGSGRCRPGRIDGGVGARGAIIVVATALDEPMSVAAAVDVISDDLARVVDAKEDARSRTGRIDGGVGVGRGRGRCHGHSSLTEFVLERRHCPRRLQHGNSLH